MASDMTGEQMQAKITAARREAEGLKDKIKRRKDELADTSRTNFLYLCSPLFPPHPDISSNEFHLWLPSLCLSLRNYLPKEFNRIRSSKMRRLIEIV